MLRLRSCIAARLLSSTSAAPISPIHRVHYAAAPTPAVSPNPSFAVEEYLVSSCGLARAQAVKASPKLSRLKSPTNPDAVLAFLARLGLSGADVATLVAKDPIFLCADVVKTLSPIVTGLTGLGLSRSEIARLVPLTCGYFRRGSIVSKLSYYLSLFGSNEKLLQLLKKNNFLGSCIEKVVKPNVALLQECGLDACNIAWLCGHVRWILGTKPERVRAIAACADALGVPRGSGMFKIALQAVALLSEEKIAAQVEYLKNMIRWSDAEVGIVVRKFPMVLAMSKEILQRKSKFLISEVGLEPAYIAQRPVMLGLRLESRLRPRYYVVKFLNENGFLVRNHGYYSAVIRTEQVFVANYICPYKKAAPHLAEDYADACRGELPSRFRFASTRSTAL